MRTADKKAKLTDQGELKPITCKKKTVRLRMKSGKDLVEGERHRCVADFVSLLWRERLCVSVCVCMAVPSPTDNRLCFMEGKHVHRRRMNPRKKLRRERAVCGLVRFPACVCVLRSRRKGERTKKRGGERDNTVTHAQNE